MGVGCSCGRCSWRRTRRCLGVLGDKAEAMLFQVAEVEEKQNVKVVNFETSPYHSHS
jgi:hypothetical protein